MQQKYEYYFTTLSFINKSNIGESLVDTRIRPASGQDDNFNMYPSPAGRKNDQTYSKGASLVLDELHNPIRLFVEIIPIKDPYQ